MKIKFENVEEAFDFVSFGAYGDHTAILDKSTGQIYWHSESGDFEEIPDEISQSADAIALPHKNDLGIGSQLVFDFVRSKVPDDYDYVRRIFGRRGAYGRYKDFLESKGLLQPWFDFENAGKEKALREWCKDKEIELTG